MLFVYLTLFYTIASCERSFSKFKLIKTYLRSKMNQNRLTNLSLLSIEKYITKTVDFDSAIGHFSAIKVKKVLNIKFKILEIWKMYRI